MLAGIVSKVGRSRDRLPAWARGLVDHVIEHPGSLLGRIAYLGVGGSADAPANPPIPNSSRRVYVAPANYAGQGLMWARAMGEDLPGTGAVNMALGVPGAHRFPADVVVPLRVFMGSAQWQREQFRYVLGFTHVLIEGDQSLFGTMFGRDRLAEVAALREHALGVAMMCHGTDIRLPSRHRERHAWSPYADDSTRAKALEMRAVAHRRLLDTLGVPVFVSTPDLLEDVPYARWCPVVVDPAKWSSERPPMRRTRPRVVHVPSSTAIKGTHLIEPALRDLDARGVIEYLQIEGVGPDQMPSVYGNADIVLDQFRIGSYGVAACEALAAGRVVVGHVSDAVRSAVREGFGLELPIVEATVETIGTVLEDLVANSERANQVASVGPAFIRRVHDGRVSAGVLDDFWLGRNPS